MRILNIIRILSTSHKSLKNKILMNNSYEEMNWE